MSASLELLCTINDNSSSPVHSWATWAFLMTPPDSMNPPRPCSHYILIFSRLFCRYRRPVALAFVCLHSNDQHQQTIMPPKKTLASTAHGPPSPIPFDDHPEPSPSIGESTVAEYNDLIIAHRKALHRIKELEANADSSHTNTSDPHPCGQKRTAPKGPISQQEKSRRIAEGLCLYCGESGHLRIDCPKKPKPESVTTISHYQAPSVAFEQPPSLSENSKSQATMR